MKQTASTHHCLECRRMIHKGEWGRWFTVGEEMPEPVRLARDGQFASAIRLAYEFELARLGTVHRVQFRCLTTQITITADSFYQVAP